MTDSASGPAPVAPPTSAFSVDYTPIGGSLTHPTVSSVSIDTQSTSTRTVTVTVSGTPFSAAGAVTVHYTQPTATTLSGTINPNSLTSSQIGIASATNFSNTANSVVVTGSTGTGGGAWAPAAYTFSYTGLSGTNLTGVTNLSGLPTVVNTASSTVIPGLTDADGPDRDRRQLEHRQWQLQGRDGHPDPGDVLERRHRNGDAPAHARDR
jgi:hypothetical protein